MNNPVHWQQMMLIHTTKQVTSIIYMYVEHARSDERIAQLYKADRRPRLLTGLIELTADSTRILEVTLHLL